MHKYVFTTVALALSLPLTTGCFPVEDSCNIKTDGLYLQLEAIEENGSVEAQAIFWVGANAGGTYLELGDCGDEIAVNGKVMTASPGYDNPEVYVASLEPSDSYDFVLSRPDEDPYTSSVSNAREAVTVTGPSDSTLSRTEAFNVAWNNNDSGEVQVSVSGSCIFSYSETVQDDGSHTVASGNLDATDEDAGESCNAKVIVDRSTAGSMAPGVAGSIETISRGASNFVTAP